MNKQDRSDWNFFLTFLTFLVAVLAFAWQAVPENLKAITFIAIMVFLVMAVLTYRFNGLIRGLIQKHLRLLRMLSIAIYNPITHYFGLKLNLNLESSVKMLIVTSIETLWIVFIVQMSKEWRTAKSLRSPITKDQVGRDLDGREPDGAPDAMFILNLPQRAF